MRRDTPPFPGDLVFLNGDYVRARRGDLGLVLSKEAGTTLVWFVLFVNSEGTVSLMRVHVDNMDHVT